MTNKQANILFIPTSIGGYSAEVQDPPSQCGYYQQLIYASLARSIYSIKGFQVIGRQLAAIARHAFLGRQMDAVEQATQLMLAIPISDQLRGVARFYQAHRTWRQGDIDNARQSLERLVEEAIPQYRARALQVIGLTYQSHGELDSALPFYLAAGKAASSCDLLTLAESQKMTAVVRSIHGDHKQALADLEGLFPLVRAIGKYYPATYYDFLNSLAVELGEVGRIAEAESALSIALASPFASVYPEWSETRDEIAAKHTAASPSVVAINRAPVAHQSPQVEPETQPEPSRVTSSNWLVSESIFLQRTLVKLVATATVVHPEITQKTADQALVCSRPRAPPSSF